MERAGKKWSLVASARAHWTQAASAIVSHRSRRLQTVRCGAPKGSVHCIRLAVRGAGAAPPPCSGGDAGGAGVGIIRGGAIAQLGERLHGMQEVGGSSPPGSTTGEPPRRSAYFQVQVLSTVSSAGAYEGASVGFVPRVSTYTTCAWRKTETRV
jgi:hypothetical protein